MNKKIIDTLYQQLNSYRNDKSKKWKGIALKKAISTIKKCNFEIVASSKFLSSTYWKRYAKTYR